MSDLSLRAEVNAWREDYQRRTGGAPLLESPGGSVWYQVEQIQDQVAALRGALTAVKQILEDTGI